jgi:hypothetical protein
LFKIPLRWSPFLPFTVSDFGFTRDVLDKEMAIKRLEGKYEDLFWMILLNWHFGSVAHSFYYIGLLLT